MKFNGPRDVPGGLFWYPIISARQANSLTFSCRIQSEIAVLSKGEAVVSITEFPDLHDVVERRIPGWMDRELEISGTRNHTDILKQSILRGADTTDLFICWD